MPNRKTPGQFQSIMGNLIKSFLDGKRSCGYQYHEGERILRQLDRFLHGKGLATQELPRPILKQWLSKRMHESATTHSCRISCVRQFARYLSQLGYSAYVPPPLEGSLSRSQFAPRILTREEMCRLLARVDQLAPTARSPYRHLIMPEILRLLYGGGFRVGELLKLRVRDVDLTQGVLTVRQGKFRKDRLVPLALSLVSRLEKYAKHFSERPPDAIFFPSPSGQSYGLRSIYGLFRQLLIQAGIPHGGRGKGPRVHDLRHTFAVHTVKRWYQEGADLDVKLPLLSIYLGHRDLSGTQKYVHVTAELFPEITTRVNLDFGQVIPRRTTP